MRKKIVSSLLSLALVLSAVPAYAASAEGYTDVSEHDWSYPAVEHMAENKYMTGYSDTQFAPNDTLSRAMFVTVLYRISGDKMSPSATRFTDVPQDTWYSEAVAWAVENGIASGTSETTFSPDEPVTRQEMACFIKRYVDRKDIDLSKHSVVVSSPADLSACGAWAADAVSFACQFGFLYENSFMAGTNYVGGEHKVDPRSNATRTDAAVACYNLLHAYPRHALLPGGHGKVTLVQESPEDPNKEFVYYILSGYTISHMLGGGVHIDLPQDHVEELQNVRWNKCGCGYVIFGCQQDPTETWEAHSIECGCSYVYSRDTVYKITLKHGERIELDPYSKPILYPEQDSQYRLAYSTDGTHFTDYVDRLSLWENGKDRSVAILHFAAIDNGTLTLKRDRA